MTVVRDTTGWTEADASGLRDTPGERWYSCDRCGQLFPESETIVEETTGLRVCLTGPKDYDEPDIDDVRISGAATSRLFGPEEVT